MAKIKITKGELKSLIKEVMALDKGLLTESKSKKIQTHPLYGIIKEELAKVKMMNSTKSKQAQNSKNVKAGQIAKKVQNSTKKPINEGILKNLVTGMAMLASTLGGKAVQAQMVEPLPMADTVIIKGFSPENVSITKKATEYDMKALVKNNTKVVGTGSDIQLSPETQEVLNLKLGAIIKKEGSTVTIVQNPNLKTIKTGGSVVTNDQTLRLNVAPTTKVIFQNPNDAATEGIPFGEGKKGSKKPLKENQMVDEGFRDVVNWVKKGALVTLAVLGGGIATMAQDMSIKVPSADTVKVYGYNPKTIQITPYAGHSIQVSTRTKFTGQASEKTDNIVATMLQPKVVETPKTGSSDTTNTGTQVGNIATSKGGNSSVSLIKPTEKFKKFATWLKGSEGGQGANIENTAEQYMRILAPKGTNFIFYDAQGNEFDSGTVQ